MAGISHNITAMSAYRNYSANSNALSRSLEKLSSGYKINRAGDDAAGLAISEKMRAQISGLTVAQKNAKDGISMVQTAEGALTEVHDMLNRMVTLAEQSANGTYSNDLDRDQLQKEVDQLRSEINRIADSANFNGIKLLDGSMDSKNKIELTSDTQVHTTFNTKAWKAFGTSQIAPLATIGGGVYNEAGITNGSNTILHRQSPDAHHAKFTVDLNDLRMNDEGTIKIAVGTTQLKTLSIGEADLSGGNVSNEVIAQKFAAQYDGLTAVINDVEYTVAADGNKIRFESVGDIKADIASEVTITISNATSYSYKTPATSAAGANTGAVLSFNWASGADDALRTGFVGATAGSAIGNNPASNTYSFTVSISREVSNTAAFNGNVTITASAGTLGSHIGSGGYATNEGTFVYGTDGKLTLSAAGAKIGSAAVVGYLEVNVENGAGANTVRLQITAKDMGVNGSLAAGSQKSLTRSEVDALVASKVNALVTSVAAGNSVSSVGGLSADQIATGAGAATRVELNNAADLDAHTGVYTTASGKLVRSSDATSTLDTTITLSFKMGTTAIAMDFKVGDFFSSLAATEVTISSTDVQKVIASKVNAAFAKTKTQHTGSTAWLGSIKAGSFTAFSSKTVTNGTSAITASGTLKVKAASGKIIPATATIGTDLTFKVHQGTATTTVTLRGLTFADLGVASYSDALAATSATTTVATADTVKKALTKKLEEISAYTDQGNYTVGLKKDDITTSAAKVTLGTGSKASLEIRAGASATATVNFKFSIGDGSNAMQLTMDLTVEELAKLGPSGKIPEKANEIIKLDEEDLKTALRNKLEDTFGKKQAYETTINVGAAPAGYTYKATAADGKTTLSGFNSLTVGTGASRVAADAEGNISIDVFSNDGEKVGTYKVNINDLKTAAKSSLVASSVSGKNTVSDQLKQVISYTKKITNAGAGDYNTATEEIDYGAAAGATRLASTMIKESVFDNKIKDGTVLKIGDTNYVFAVGASSALTQDSDGNVLVNLKDQSVDAGKTGLTGDALETALKRLTLAAGSNAMFGVGYDAVHEEFTLTENYDYYKNGEDGQVLLDTKKTIANQIQWGEVSGKQTTEEVDNASEVREANDLTLQIGDTSDSFNQLKVSMKDMHTDAMGIGTIDISSQEGAQVAVDKIKDAINYVSDMRGTLGATQNRLEHTINNLSVMTENIQDAESTIRDTDVAEEMMAFTKWSILNQAAQAMLAQANQLPQGVLQLLG